TFVYIDDAGGNFVNIGNQGNAQSILQSVYLVNSSGQPSTGDTLTVDDSTDPTTTPYTVVLGGSFSIEASKFFGEVDGLLPNGNSVFFDPASLKSLIVKTPAVNNTVNVQNTFAPTYVISGGNSGSSMIFGHDTVNVGDNSNVQDIGGDLYIEN